MALRDSARSQAGPRPAADDNDDILAISDLHVEFRRGGQRTPAVRGLSVSLQAGRIVGVAGESGSGKTASALAAMGLLPDGTHVTGSIRYRGTELLGMPERLLRQCRGRDIAMIFQETATALNPVIRVGQQLTMATRAHFGGSRAQALDRVRAALADVQLRDADRVLRSYPHELSGGMCQRVIIAMALSCGSKVLLADEPTTALDVSVQEEILELIRGLVAERQLAVMMISHDLAVLAELCDELIVMYQGEVVETAAADVALRAPAHPYTKALLDCLPRLHGDRAALPEIAQRPDLPGGCRFRSRCDFASDACREHPDLAPLGGRGDGGRQVRCWHSDQVLAASRPAGDQAEGQVHA
jgi:oligopeptide/dipeptide ABC transporter ATP-binding protein